MFTDRWMDKEEVIRMYNGILFIKKNEAMLFAATWMDLEIIILSEISQRKTNIIWYRLHVKSKKLCVLCLVMSLSNPMDCSPSRLLDPWDSSGKNTRVGCHSLLQGICLTQGLNPCLLHWQAVSLPTEPPRKPPKMIQMKLFTKQK